MKDNCVHCQKLAAGKNKKSMDPLTKLKIILAIEVFILITVVPYAYYLKVTKWDVERYEAWTKHTGNPGNLSYKEWRNLPQPSSKRCAH
jgi:hypothetical protein